MATQISEAPVDGWEKFVNTGFGNRCVICGNFFDEGGICNCRHEQGKTYYRPPARGRPGLVQISLPKREDPKEIVCNAYSGCKCTVCHAFFGDGDDICANGHQIGQKYPRR